MIFIASDKYAIKGVAESKQGGRKENQDDMGFIETPLGFLMVVCDGMGGGPGGKTASHLALQVFMHYLLNCNEQSPRQEALKQAIGKANEALYTKMAEEPSLQGMGTTLVAILLNEQSALIAHLGDSRCYQLNEHKLKFRTTDHSLVAELVKTKALTEEQARVSPQSNIIKRALGNTSNHIPEIEEVAFKKGDRFVLCSDGVWGIMPQKDLLARLTSNQKLDTIVTNLSAEIDQIGFSHGGGHDNHTLLMVELGFDSLKEGKMNKKAKVIIVIMAVLLLLSMALNGILMVNNNGKTDALQKQVVLQSQQINDLTVIKKRYDEIIKGETGSVIKDLQIKIDSLQQVSGMQEAKMLEEKEPVELLEKAIEQLNELLTTKADSPDFRETTKLKGKIRDKVKEILIKFDESTSKSFTAEVNDIINGMEGDAIVEVEKSSFKPTERAKTLIEKRIIEIDDLIKKINK